MITWEYSIVERTIKRVKKKRTLSRPKVQSDFYWELEESWDIRHPDGTDEHLQGEDLSSGAVLNRMGAAGWELVSEVVWERATGTSQGFPSADFPIRTLYTMKRFK